MSFVVFGPGRCWGATEGPSTPPEKTVKQVRFIKFHGIEKIDQSDLKKILDTREKRFRWFSKAPLDEDALKEDLGRIERYYRGEGFLHAQVLGHRIVPIAGDDVRIEIEISEGPPMMVSELQLSIKGDAAQNWRQELYPLLPLQVDERFTAKNYQNCEKVALRYFADLGYPKARVDLKARLNKNTNRAQVTVAVETGPVCTFGDITIKDNKDVSDEVILREVTFKKGERFKASRIRQTQQRLFNLQLFQFVDLTVKNMEGGDTELPVEILVKEGKRQTVRAGIGYGTEDQFRGRLNWEMRNFLGGGRRLQFDAKASSIIQVVEGGFTQPYFLGHDSILTVDAGFAHEDQESFENRKFFLTPKVQYQFNKELVAYGGYSLEANRLLEIDPDAAVFSPLDRENEDYYVSSLLGGINWERLDDPIDPKKGLRFIQGVEWASAGLGSEVDFLKLSFEGRGYMPLNKVGVLAMRLKYGWIQELENTDNVPIYKRFFSGGSNSVRGYPYQKLGPLDADGEPVGGLSLVEGNVDWRFPLIKKFEGVLFFDFGNVYAENDDAVWSDLRYSTGAGLRYNTPVGPLRLDFGYQLNPPEDSDFERYQVHFSIGQAF